MSEKLLDLGICVKSNTFLITDEITVHTYQNFERALVTLDTKKPIKIKICSEGGDIYSTLAIVGRMRSSKIKFVTEAYGCALSAAGLILAAGHKRYMSRHAYFMNHRGNYPVTGEHNTKVSTVAHMEQVDRDWCELMGQFTKKPAQYWYDSSNSGDNYLSAYQCKEYGVVDEIV